MLSIRKHITGVPYGGYARSRGDQLAPDAWSAAVTDQTKDLPTVKSPYGCILSMEVTKTKFENREAAGAVLEIVT
jgi:hypothetical protein